MTWLELNMDNEHIGSSFDEFLDECGIREEVDAEAMDRVRLLEINQPINEESNDAP